MTEDCGTDRGIFVSAVVEGGEVVASLTERTLGRTACEDVLDPATGKVLVARNEEITEDVAELLEAAKVQKVKVRSALTCDLKTGVCGKCYGRDLARGTPVNIGEAVGVIAAQSIGEPGTQLTMRTFHIGGTAQVSEQSTLEATAEGVVSLRNANLTKNTDGDRIVMSRNCQLVIADAQGNERAAFKLPYASRVRVEEGATVARGQRLADWDPFTLKILTESKGRVKFVDMIEGVSVTEVAEEATGITSKVVTEWRSAGSKANADLRPSIVIVDAKGVPVRNASGGEARYVLSVGAILSREDGEEVGPGDELARIPTGSAKSRDITGGLPRVAELFEARKPKDHAILADANGRIEFGKDYKNKRRIILKPEAPEGEEAEPIEYLIPKGKHVAVQEGDYVERGDAILDGNPAPHDILRIKGVEALADYLVNEIQEVYRLQGVKINDKHIEVIVRQMLQKIEVEDSGETTLLPGEQIDQLEFDEVNDKAIAEGLKPATGKSVLLGITKASLHTRSFFSAASFQETTRVLTEAAVQGKVDTLVGLKENVIVGRLIPAGTGGMISRMKEIAADKDSQLLAANEPSAEAAAAVEPNAA